MAPIWMPKKKETAMSHVQRRERGGRVRWVGRVPAGDGTERTKTFDRKVDAERWARSQENARDRGDWIDPRMARTTVEAWAPKWLSTKRRLKPSTLQGYEALLRSRILPAFGRKPLARMDRADVEAWVGAMVQEGLSPASVRKAHVVLTAMLDSAVDNGLIGRNVAKRVELPRRPKVERMFLRAEQVQRLADDLGDYRALVLVLGYGRLRWGEVAALRRGDCDLLRVVVDETTVEIHGRVHFGTPKGHQVRVVRLPSFVAEALARHLEGVPADPEALVFSAAGGTPLRYGNFRKRVWNPACGRTGLDGVTPHVLRHTAASLLRAAGADAKAISSHLGHRSVAFTLDTYVGLFEDDLDDVMDRLEGGRPQAQTGLGRDGLTVLQRAEAP